jgi:hypothetical protein
MVVASSTWCLVLAAAAECMCCVWYRVPGSLQLLLRQGCEATELTCRGSSRRGRGGLWCLVTGRRLGGGSCCVADLCGSSGLAGASVAVGSGVEGSEMGLLRRHDPPSAKRSWPVMREGMGSENVWVCLVSVAIRGVLQKHQILDGPRGGWGRTGHRRRRLRTPHLSVPGPESGNGSAADASGTRQGNLPISLSGGKGGQQGSIVGCCLGCCKPRFGTGECPCACPSCMSAQASGQFDESLWRMSDQR